PEQITALLIGIFAKHPDALAGDDNASHEFEEFEETDIASGGCNSSVKGKNFFYRPPAILNCAPGDIERFFYDSNLPPGRPLTGQGGSFNFYGHAQFYDFNHLGERAQALLIDNIRVSVRSRAYENTRSLPGRNDTSGAKRRNGFPYYGAADVE